MINLEYVWLTKNTIYLCDRWCFFSCLNSLVGSGIFRKRVKLAVGNKLLQHLQAERRAVIRRMEPDDSGIGTDGIDTE